MSEKDKHTLTGWVIGVSTMAAVALATWTLTRSVTQGEVAAVVQNRLDNNDEQHKEIKKDLETIKQDVRALLLK